MVKALLLSLIIAHIVIPAYFAGGKNPRLSFRRMTLAMVAFNLLYLIGLLYIYPRLEG